jgi:hypothetical protein
MMPGGALYYAERAFSQLSKDGVDPTIAQTLLAQLDWSLHAPQQPPQKPQYYYNYGEYRSLHGVHGGGIPGEAFYGPDAPVIATSLRPKGAKPLKPVNDN